MAKFDRFEDIIAWQKARLLTAEVYKTSGVGLWRRDFGLRDQITRAAVSVMNNIAEGFGRHNSKEFARYLEIAKGSAHEVQSMLYEANDIGYIDEKTRIHIYTIASEAVQIIAGLVKYLRSKEQ